MTQWRDIEEAASKAGRSTYSWHIAGTLAAGDQQGPTFFPYTDIKPIAVIAFVETTGTVSGSTDINIEDDGTELLSADLAIAFDDADGKAESTTFAANVVAAGSKLTLDIDAIPGGADSADLTVTLVYETLVS